MSALEHSPRRMPSRRTQVAVALGVALAVAVAGAHWQLERIAGRALGDLAGALAPFATLTWTDHGIDRHGRVVAHGVALVHHGDARRAEAATLWLDLGGPRALLRALGPGARGMPERLRLGVAGLRLPLAAPAGNAALGLDALEVAPCAGLDRDGTLRALGHDALSGEAELGYALDATRGELTLDAQLTAHGLWRLDLALGFEGERGVALERFVGGAPLARRGSVAVGERGWYAASAALCAARAGLGPTDWLDAHLASVAELLAAEGVAASPGLLAAYRGFRSAPRQARLAFDNSARLGLGDLLRQDPAELAQLLGLEVGFDGVAVADAGLSLVGPQRLPAVAPLADLPSAGDALSEPTVRMLLPPVAAAPPAPAPAGAPKVAPRRAAPTRAVAWEALGGLRGRWITVTLRDGRQHVGILRDADAQRLSLEKKLFGGSAVIPLERAAVKRITAAR